MLLPRYGQHHDAPARLLLGFHKAFGNGQHPGYATGIVHGLMVKSRIGPKVPKPSMFEHYWQAQSDTVRLRV